MRWACRASRSKSCSARRTRKLQGNHTGGSRSTVGAGSVCHLAALKLIEQGKALAALELQARAFAGQLRARRVQLERSQAHGQARASSPRRRPLERDAPKASSARPFPTAATSPKSRSIPRPARREIVSYCAVDDCGVVINHAIVEGQLHGGVVQGAGQVFGEHVVYDRETGQPLTASFMDYFMPRAGCCPASAATSIRRRAR